MWKAVRKKYKNVILKVMINMKKIIAPLLISTSLLLSGCYNIGNGEKIGVIVKLAKTGIFCKTWEAELIRGGLNAGSGVFSQPFYFTIEDESLVPVIKDALENQKEIKIHYSSEAVSFCRSDSGSHFLTSVDAVEKPTVIQSTTSTESGSKINQLIEELHKFNDNISKIVAQ